MAAWGRQRDERIEGGEASCSAKQLQWWPWSWQSYMPGFWGWGAYLQYESGRLFDQMWTSEEGRALEAEYRQTARRSGAAEVVRQGHWMPGRGHRRMAGAGQTDESPGVRRFSGQRPDLGRAGHTALVAQKAATTRRLLCSSSFGAGRHGWRCHRRAVPSRRGQTRADRKRSGEKWGFSAKNGAASAPPSGIALLPSEIREIWRATEQPPL